jgi:hypothetical protein
VSGKWGSRGLRAIGGFVIPASVRIDCRPGQPSVNATTAVSAVRPTHLEVSPDQHGHVGVGPCDSIKDLPLSRGCFDIADANLEMPFTAMTAADEGRINGDGDR